MTRYTRLLVSVLLVLVLIAIEIPAGANPGRGTARTVVGALSAERGREQMLKAYADLPLTFVENRGQTNERVHYYARGSRYAFYFTREEVLLSFVKGGDTFSALPAIDTAAEARRSGLGPAGSIAAADKMATQTLNLALRFLDANPNVELEGEERAPGDVNYLRGNDPARWYTRLPGYAAVVYRELWPGVDLLLRGQDGQLKYEFRVRPGARPGDIRLAYAGADGLRLDDAGGLVIQTPLGELRDSPPVTYQEIAGARVPVESRYVLNKAGGSDGEYGFAVGTYRPDRELIIDPGVDYSTFLGGASHELGAGIAVDTAGNAYIVGTTQSSDFPTTLGAFDRSFAGGVVDVFVSKLNSDGSALVYSTYLGGTPTPPLEKGAGDPFEYGRAIAIDADGHAYVTGQTTSGDFPTTSGAFDTTLNVGERDATDTFVTKLNPTGSGLVYSTFLGGTNLDDTDGITIDSAGNAYVTGRTSSADFPTTTGAFQTSLSGGFDAFVTKLNATGSALAYSTYLGGADNEVTERVVVDGSGNAYVAGSTRSQAFPTTPGVFQPIHSGGLFENLFEVFVVKLDPTGTNLIYSTFLGGTNRDHASGLAVDGGGHAYVTGGTLSPEFPTTPGAFDTVFDGTSESFVTKLSPDASALVYSTFLSGGSSAAIALDADNNAWLTGGAGTGAPTTADGFQTQFGGGDTDAYVAQLSADGSALIYATFLGGTNGESGSDVTLDATGNIYVTGTTYSPDFPTTAGALDNTFDGDPTIFWGDAFVTKLGSGSTSAPPPADRTTSNFSGEVDKHQTVSHTVSVGAAGPVDLTLDWSETRANLTLRVLDPSGNVVFSDGSTARPKTGTFSAAGAGDYLFEITNTTDRQSTYTLSVTYPVASSSEPEPVALSSLSLEPTSVTGGNSSTGTVTLTAAAPEGGVLVALSSSNTAAATVPTSVTVPAGATSASFTVSTSSVSSDTSSTISATYDGATLTAILSVTAPVTNTDTVAITRAEYDSGKQELRVEATSTSASATLTVHVTATDELIGTLSNLGGGNYGGQFNWPVNPERITVRSSLGGSATGTVTAK